MSIGTNAVVFRHNVQCRIKTYDDKNPIFKTTAEAVTFQRGLGKHSCSLALLAGGPGGARL